MTKKTVLVCATAMFSLIVLAACGKSAIIGTWYQTDLSTGEQTTIQFDDDGTGIEGATAFTWREDKGVYTLTSGTHAMQVSIEDDSMTYTSPSGTSATYYRDQARAQQMYEDARQARVDEASAEKERIIERLSGELEGTYVRKGVETWAGIDAWEVTYNADGTWSKHSVEHLDPDYATKRSREVTTDSSGTWKIAYEDTSSNFPDEQCSIKYFCIKILKADGSEFTNDERNRVSENEYPNAAKIVQAGSSLTIEANHPYEKKS